MKKIFILGMALTLVACGGSSKGKEVSEWDFRGFAEERYQAYQNDPNVYSQAVINSFYTESYTKVKAIGKQVLQRQNNKWVEVSTESTSYQADGYYDYFKYVMPYYDEFMHYSLYVSKETAKYYVADKSATITAKDDGSGGSYLKASLSITWNECGLLTSFTSKSTMTIPMVGSNTTTIKLTVQYS